MEKLTDFQIENLIETTIKNNKKIKNSKLIEFYKNKWDSCKTKREKHEFLNEFFSKRKKMINEGYDVSMLDENFLSSLFTGGLGGFKSTFKEWLAGKLVSALGVEDPELKKAISISIANLSWTKDWTKLLSPIKNCEYFASQIIHDVMEYYIAKKADTWFGGGVFASSLRNAVVDSLNSEEHIKSLENSISGIVCNAIRKVFGGGNIMSAVKSAVSGSKSGGQPSPSAVV